MEYKKLLLAAPAWREVFDPDTNTLVLRADFSTAGFCETFVVPIPGTDPPQFTYECLPVTCEGKCGLRKRKMPDGTVIVFCACVDGNANELAVSAAKRSRAKSGASKKKKVKKKAKGR